MKVTPVTLPPGRLRLETMPCFTGSPAREKMIGIVLAAAIAARSGAAPQQRSLRACSGRPRGGSAAQQRDELAPSHSITSSRDLEAPDIGAFFFGYPPGPAGTMP